MWVYHTYIWKYLLSVLSRYQQYILEIFPFKDNLSFIMCMFIWTALLLKTHETNKLLLPFKVWSFYSYLYQIKTNFNVNLYTYIWPLSKKLSSILKHITLTITRISSEISDSKLQNYESKDNVLSNLYVQMVLRIKCNSICQ